MLLPDVLVLHLILYLSLLLKILFFSYHSLSCTHFITWNIIFFSASSHHYGRTSCSKELMMLTVCIILNILSSIRIVKRISMEGIIMLVLLLLRPSSNSWWILLLVLVLSILMHWLLLLGLLHLFINWYTTIIWVARGQWLSRPSQRWCFKSFHLECIWSICRIWSLQSLVLL